MDKIKILNSMEIIESSVGCGEVEYILVENSKENIKLLKSIGASDKDIEHMRDDEGSEELEIAQFAFEKTEAFAWHSETGFMTREQTMQFGNVGIY